MVITEFRTQEPESGMCKVFSVQHRTFGSRVRSPRPLIRTFSRPAPTSDVGVRGEGQLNGSRVRSRHNKCRDGSPHRRAEVGGLRMENGSLKIKTGETNPSYEFEICDFGFTICGTKVQAYFRQILPDFAKRGF